ncbi:MAG TPA: EamA family transporter, partial [Candidatus Paceibacterota bacterium]|nr:EamA family transporter [Candidatus Paceibacterota bacterium]
MLPSFITTLLFAMSAVTAARSTRMLGSLQANFWRLIVATSFLALWAHSFGQGLTGPGLPIFLVSGFIGFGVGDLALYFAYPRLGARLTILLAQCLAAPIGAAIEWAWLGTTLSLSQIFWISVILGGVYLAISPVPIEAKSLKTVLVGTACGILAALGQAGGAVLSRKAFEITKAAGQSLDGMTAAYQRILAGLVIGSLVYLVHWIRENRIKKTMPAMAKIPLRRVAPWVLANGLSGPALGAGCYQWALA